YVAGGLSLEDAARVVALRSKLIGQRLAGLGGMVSVALPAAEVAGQIEAYAGRVSVATVNGPAAVVGSGEPGALEELLAGWGRGGRWTTRRTRPRSRSSVLNCLSCSRRWHRVPGGSRSTRRPRAGSPAPRAWTRGTGMRTCAGRSVSRKRSGRWPRTG